MRGGTARLVLSVALALLCVVRAAVIASAQQDAAFLQVNLNKNQVTVGERIEVTVTLRLPAAAQPDLANLDRRFGDLEPLVIGLPEEERSADSKEIRIRYQVAAFRPGAVEFPPLTVSYQLNGQTAEVSAPAVAVNVQSVLAPDEAPAQPRDLKPQIELPFHAGLSRRTVVTVAIAGVGAVAVLTVLAIVTVRLRRRPPSGPVTPQASPAEVTAREELERIAGLGLLEQGDLKTLHRLLAVCIRRYLSERYGFAAFAMTTTELTASMEVAGVDRWPARLVSGLLGECDAVTYGGYEPALVRAQTNLTTAQEIVEITKAGADPVPAVW